MRRWAVCVRIAPRTRCLRSSPGRAAVLSTAGSPFEPGRRLRALAAGEGRVASSVRKRVPVRVRPGAPGGCSSAGRAPPRHGGGHGFEARYPLAGQAVLAQLAEAPRSGRGGSGFESLGRYVEVFTFQRVHVHVWPRTATRPSRARTRAGVPGRFRGNVPRKCVRSLRRVGWPPLICGRTGNMGRIQAGQGQT